jgi:Ran GTPase-activating protein (RanGAP) involved in mRNA processing and transport
MLFEDALSNEHCALTELDLTNCSLTDRCIPSLCKALQDEHCKLTDLSLYGNVISDEGASMLLKDALLKEHCKLKKLNLTDCRLTDDFISSLRKVLPKMNVVG